MQNQKKPESEEKQCKLKCYVCGKTLPSTYLQQLTKRQRKTTTHGLCDKCIKKRNEILDKQKSKW